MIVLAYSTVRETPPPEFDHQDLDIKSRDDSGLVTHLHSVIDWACDSGKVELDPTLYAVIRHLERTRALWQFEVDGSDLEQLGPQLAAWGRQSNSIFAMPDRTLRDPDGAVLVDRETGNVDPAAVVPYPQDARERNGRNRELIKEHGIDVSANLPPIVGESEVVWRSSEEVGWRILSLFIVAVRAESVATKQPITAEQLRGKSPMAFESLSPAEQAFLETQQPDESSVINFAWRYEALYALQWALGLHAELQPADAICNVPLVAETMVDRLDRELVTETRLRPSDELLDAIDLNGQLLWAARQARIEDRPAPAKLDGGVLSERQHAFNWLIRLGDAPWDHVDTPT